MDKKTGVFIFLTMILSIQLYRNQPTCACINFVFVLEFVRWIVFRLDFFIMLFMAIWYSLVQNASPILKEMGKNQK